MRRTVYTEEQEEWRLFVRAFLTDEVLPQYDAFLKAGAPTREFWKRAGELGILGIAIPEKYGGKPGSGYKHSAIVTEEAQRLGMMLGGLRVHTDICLPYFMEYGTDEQKQRYLPRLCDGSTVCALAMSEPAAGSDMKAMSTKAVRDGDVYIVDGAKTFISNGLNADLVILAAKTDPDAGRRGISMLVVEASSEGFERGAKLEKIGQKAQDLAELFFADMAVPVADRLGEENRGFEYLMHNLAQERLSIAVNAQSSAVAALDNTVQLLSGGDGKVGQNAKFEVAACAAEVQAGQSMVDQALDEHELGELSGTDAAALKLYCTEMQGRVIDRCMQLLGPGGCSYDSPLGRAYVDARVTRIYGGSSEIMKVIVAQSLGL